jgi:CRP-like cAMP-binding protein
MSGQANGLFQKSSAYGESTAALPVAPALEFREHAQEIVPPMRPEQLAWLDTPLACPSRFAKRRSLFRAGDKAEHIFEVESGAVMVHRILNDGRRQLIEIVFPGGFCGFASGDRHESDCETLTPVVVRVYKRSELVRYHALSARVAGRLQRQILSLHDHVVSLGRMTAEERVCTLVLRLLESEAQVNDAGGQASQYALSLPLTRTEIADYLGLTLGTVCRTFADLQRRKILETGNHKSEIKVPDLARLRQAACWDAG